MRIIELNKYTVYQSKNTLVRDFAYMVKAINMKGSLSKKGGFHLKRKLFL